MKWVITAVLLILPANVFSESATSQPGGSRIKIWNKDPFITPSARAEPHRPAGVEKESTSGLTLSSVLFSKEHSSAVINGRVFHLGDEVSGLRILDIQRTYVIFASGKKRFRLELKK